VTTDDRNPNWENVTKARVVSRNMLDITDTPTSSGRWSTGRSAGDRSDGTSSNPDDVDGPAAVSTQAAGSEVAPAGSRGGGTAAGSAPSPLVDALTCATSAPPTTPWRLA